ncbi:DNA-processing protein DprA [Leucobacter chironomi]|uniref:DNA-processing protein DprA n=1 Tax=Leucobacter chironomi TaxID=491918 RepID=UPI00040153E7|nr:DNA-processing protein DprA [Leucobacter chironomi]
MSGGESEARRLLGVDGEVRERLARLEPAPNGAMRDPGGTGDTGDPDGSGDGDGADDGGAALFARVVWARLVEPGDAIAGGLVSALGPVRALGLLLGGVEAGRAREEALADGGVELDSAAMSKAFARWRLRLDRAASLGDLERGIDAGMRLVAPGSAYWPSALDDLGEHTPLLLWARGELAALSAFSVAVVGARACTGYGAGVTAELTEALCAAGAAIVSGAAYGIDAVAHRTALALDSPTVAVLAGGADRVYPSSHGPLLARIAETGAVCSEMVPGAAPTRWRFLQRNRTIAALARATLVTEAGVRSGSLNTAGHAAALGRPLGAVPGPITSSASAGCHRLIRDYDATLVTSGTELLELLGVSPNMLDLPETDERELSLHVRVIDALPLRGSRSLEELATVAGIDPHRIQGVLAELELLGRVRCHDDATNGRRYSLAHSVR